MAKKVRAVICYCQKMMRAVICLCVTLDENNFIDTAMKSLENYGSDTPLLRPSYATPDYEQLLNKAITLRINTRKQKNFAFK